MEGVQELAQNHLEQLKDSTIPEIDFKDLDFTEKTDPNSQETNLRDSTTRSAKILLGRYITIHKKVALSFAILHF